MTQTPVIGVAPITNQDDMNCAKDMMRQIHQQIILDIKTGNCKPKEATRRYNMTARMLSQPMCDETTKKRYVFWRAKYNKRKRYEKTLFTNYNEAVAANVRSRLAAMRVKWLIYLGTSGVFPLPRVKDRGEAMELFPEFLDTLHHIQAEKPKNHLWLNVFLYLWLK